MPAGFYYDALFGNFKMNYKFGEQTRGELMPLCTSVSTNETFSVKLLYQSTHNTLNFSPRSR